MDYTTEELNSLAVDIQPFIDNLYIGNLCGALNETLLKKHDIKCVIHLFEDSNLFEDDPDKHSYVFQIEDDPFQELSDYFQMFDLILDISQIDHVLIHCQHGSSRTGAFTLYYLIKHKKMSYQEALEYAKNIRAGIKPNPGFVAQLKSLSSRLGREFKQPLEHS